MVALTPIWDKIVTCFQEAGYPNIVKDKIIFNFDNFLVTYKGYQEDSRFTDDKNYFVIGISITPNGFARLMVHDDKGSLSYEYSFFFELVEDIGFAKLDKCKTCNCLKYYKICTGGLCNMCKPHNDYINVYGSKGD